tara:strand:- start:316 stop:561 length:246 start_codon:yes stop_codon:yes gene_type:complete
MFTIYSKPNCPFCNKFKRVVELEDLPHIVYELGVDFTREEFYNKFGSGSTFPQILLDDLKLGGCQESLRHMQKENICCNVL